MADDREVLREVWEGRIPACFDLASDEVTSPETPDPFFLLLPRLSYLTLVTEKVQKHFKKHTESEETDEMWFDFEGQPLKWHYPVGVLYDLVASSCTLPWKLTVHFKHYPEQEILHCRDKEIIEAHYMSCVKEADVLKHRGIVINNMQRRDHKQLWSGLQNDKFDQFWTTNRKLMEHHNEEPFRYVPFKIYQPDKMYLQQLFKPYSEEGEPLTLGHLLKELLPEIFPDREPVEAVKVLIQGTEPPFDTPIQWLSEHLSHPDNFLHICIIKRT
ncbi:autophagy protein 5-like [Anneissia japonica]|uniref:autophagy protein 5-like n=1 Tax=Anneissia japonica TaxID=1529436 RepID=UPI0014255BBE|nr:autophagy protein 5-like [Anneissia japonica]